MIFLSSSVKSVEANTIRYTNGLPFRYDTRADDSVSFFNHGKEETMEEKLNSFMEEEKIGKLVRKFSLPCIVSLLVGALYNIVDQVFIANAPYLGSCGNAANTVVFPLTVLALAVAVMIGDGCCAFVSLSLGKGEKDNASSAVGNAVILTVISSIVLTVLYLVFSSPILTFFGGRVNDETYAFSREYFFWITLGLPFYMFGQALNPIIRSDSSPRFAMVSTVAGAVTNLILDPVFIYGFRWGMTGAAVATVIGQIITAVMAVWYLFHMKTVKIEKKSFRLNGTVLKRFLPLGLTSLLSQVSLVISMAAVQKSCTKYGALDPVFGLEEFSQIPLAVLGIVMKFFQIAISIAIGIAAGSIPVAGYNRGAGRNDRVKSLFVYVLLSEAAVGVAALFIVEVFPLQIASLFGAAGESSYYASFTVKCFRIYLSMMVLSTVNKGTFIFLQALGKGLESTLISLVREIIFGVFLPVVLPVFMGLDGLLWSFPLSDILTAVITAFFIVKTMKELSTPVQSR